MLGEDWHFFENYRHLVSNENFLRIIGNFFLCCISVVGYCQLVVMWNVIIIHVSSPARKELWRTIFRRL